MSAHPFQRPIYKYAYEIHTAPVFIVRSH